MLRQDRVGLLESTSLQELAYQALLQKIALRVLKPGQQVSEPEIASELGMSRTPVRAAIQALVRDGMLCKNGAHRCCVVNPSPQDILENLEVREAIEGMAAAVMATRGDREQVRLLEDLATALELAQRQENVGMYMQKDFEFHRHLIRGCGNHRLSGLVAPAPLVLVTFMSATGADPEPWESSVPHSTIVEAVRARDPSAAEAAARLHLKVSRHAVEAALGRASLAETPIML
jgi:DNA-binding GntR family transcriptional regulator